MALDGAFLSKLLKEISETALDARVDRIFQPGREEIIIVLRWRGGSGKLLLSANADSARIQFTQASYENPKTPPMFCMFLRKHLGSARLIEIKQIAMDRIVHLVFETLNELGDLVKIHILRQADLSGVNLQSIQSALEVGSIHDDPAVEPAGTQQRLVQNFGTVGGGQTHDALGGLETVNFGQQLV